MQNGDEALLSSISAGRGLLVKMVVTLKPHGIFCANFTNLSVHFNIFQKR